MFQKNFVEQAMRTNNPNTGTYGTNPDLVHAVLGFISEINEFCDALTNNDNTNAVEELGDTMWFAALFQQATGFVVEFGPDVEPQREIHPITVMGELADLLKAHYAYGGKKEMRQVAIESEIAVVMGEQLQDMIQVLAGLLKETDETIAELAQSVVINKLKARYPEKFKTEQALKRDLGYEAEVIGKSLEA